MLIRNAKRIASAALAAIDLTNTTGSMPFVDGEIRVLRRFDKFEMPSRRLYG